MTSNPLVSVLIPVYNVEKYVKEALVSILNQTYENIEIILVDDGSTDDTYLVSLEMSKLDGRIKLYKNTRNLGIVKTLNKALDYSSGEYILRMDGDDISELDRIERKLKYLLDNDDIDLVGCSLIAIDEKGQIIKKIRKLDSFHLIKETLRYTSPVSHIWMCRRSTYKALDGYRELPGAEDYDFILRLISSGMKCANISDYYGYKVRIARPGNSISTAGIEQKKLHEYIYKMYSSRLNGLKEGYISNYKPKYLRCSKILYLRANQFFYFGKLTFLRRRYAISALYFICSASSPHMLHIYWLRLLYKIKTYKWSKS